MTEINRIYLDSEVARALGFANVRRDSSHRPYIKTEPLPASVTLKPETTVRVTQGSRVVRGTMDHPETRFAVESGSK